MSQILTMKRFALEKVLSGNTINLVSNDAQKLDMLGEHVAMAMSAPIEMMGSCFVLWYLVGWQALVGVGAMLVNCLYTVCISKVGAKLRHKAAAVTDKRLAVMNEIVSGIRALKICAWEENYCRLARTLRQ